MYANPPLTDWLRHAMRDPDERQEAFARIFDIESRLGDTDQERLKHESRRKRWSDKRKAILDEQADVELAVLVDYVGVNAFIELSVTHLAEQCRTRHLLIV
jgi:hypothetical protein